MARTLTRSLTTHRVKCLHSAAVLCGTQGCAVNSTLINSGDFQTDRTELNQFLYILFLGARRKCVCVVSSVPCDPVDCHTA